MTKGLYIGTLIVFLIVFIVILISVIKSKKKKRMYKALDELEKEKNLLINVPVLSELSKVEALIKNNKLEEKYNAWKLKFDIIEKETIPYINDMLIEADFLVEKSSSKEVYKKIAEIEIKLAEIKTKVKKIMSEIKEITLSEEKNRATVIKLKSQYRNLKSKFESAKSDYEETTKTIELQFETIEKRFEEFEIVMEKKDYDEVIYVVKGLTEMLDHMSIVINEMPEIMLMGKSLIPKRTEDVSSEYIKLTREGYQLDYLNVEYNIVETEKKVSSIFDRVRVLNLEDVSFELKTILDYYDSLFNDFETEKLSRKYYEDGLKSFKKTIKHVYKVLTAFDEKLPEMKENYNITDDTFTSLELFKKELASIKKDYQKLMQLDNNHTFAFSKLNQELEIIALKLSKLHEKVNSLLQKVGNLHEDEQRARSQLEDIKLLLKQSKYQIRKNRLPIIPNNYYVELKEASDAIYEIQKELNKKPIDVDTLNIRVNTARDLAFKLHNTTATMVKHALLSEYAIVYGNRYRSSKPMIDEGLQKAENLFFEGEYKMSLDLSISTLDIVEPGIHKKILDYKK
ncbi:MAG: septation ring formation regulator EzrA [Tenericutes bacterium]|nr:septation ring formation regulator EzrA [Mycoplasmatota bacterium]